MSGNETNLKRSIEKSNKMTLDYVLAAEEGMSPYHLKKKGTALKAQLEKVESLFSELPEEEPITEEWETINGREFRFVTRGELSGDSAFNTLKGRNFEIWGKSPKDIRLPHQAIKPLEFIEEFRSMRERADSGFVIYEVRK